MPEARGTVISVLFLVLTGHRSDVMHLDSLRSVKKMVCLPSLLSRPPAMSPDLRIEVTSKEHTR